MITGNFKIALFFTASNKYLVFPYGKQSVIYMYFVQHKVCPPNGEIALEINGFLLNCSGMNHIIYLFCSSYVQHFVNLLHMQSKHLVLWSSLSISSRMKQKQSCNKLHSTRQTSKHRCPLHLRIIVHFSRKVINDVIK